MAALAAVPHTSLAARVKELELLASTLDALDSADELTPELYDQLQQQLIESLAGTREKIDRTAAVLADYRAAAAAAKAEKDRLAARQQRYERHIERIETYVLAILATSGIAKLDGLTATLSARRNPESLVIDDADAIPGTFYRIPPPSAPVPDKNAIKAEIKRGHDVPGCRLVQTERLVVS